MICSLSLFQSALKTPIASRVIAPAPAQGHLALPHKVPGHIAVTMESTMPQASGIPVATISGQQVEKTFIPA